MRRISLKASRLALAIMVLSGTSAQGTVATPELVSARSAAISASAGGNADSIAPLITPDGRFVLFSSLAADLVENGSRFLTLNAYVRDRDEESITLVSPGLSGSGAGEHSVPCGISTNGRFVLLESAAVDLVEGLTNSFNRIFLRDRMLGTNLLVSVSMDGGLPNGHCTDPVMTPDGRYVVFWSAATNMVSGDTNRIADLFMRDVVTGSNTLVSIGAIGTNVTTGMHAVTPDGRYVAFFSTAIQLAEHVPASSRGEVYLRDLVAGTTTWVSSNAASVVSSTLGLASMPSLRPAISDDGRFIAYKTGWTNAAAAPVSGAALSAVFRYDRDLISTDVVSTNAMSTWFGQGDAFGPAMTPDGRFIAFVSTNSAGGGRMVQLWDALSADAVNVSVDVNGTVPADSRSDTPRISADGRYVCFLSDGIGLSGSAVSNGFHIYLRDMQEGITVLLDSDTNGVGSVDQLKQVPAMTSDGRFVAFSSWRSLIGGVEPVRDVFLYDRAGALNPELMSMRAPGVVSASGGGISLAGLFPVSDDGRRVVFASHSADLVAGDTNETGDVFVRDFESGTTSLVSVGTDGMFGSGFSAEPMLSRNGRFVSFSSAATNLVAGRTNIARNIFLRDLEAGTTVIVSANPVTGVPGNRDASHSMASDDGRYVAFLSAANNLGVSLGGTGPYSYLMDLQSESLIALAGAFPAPAAPMLSADGRFAAYFIPGPQVQVRDNLTGLAVYTNGMSGTTSAALSPNGKRLLWTTATSVHAADVLTATMLLTEPSAVRIAAPDVWSADGRYVAIVTRASLDLSDVNGTNDVYLCDLDLGTSVLASVNAAGSASGNNCSELPALSADGRFVIYRSYANDLVGSGLGAVPNLYRYDRVTQKNILLTPGSEEDRFGWHGKPSVSGDGSVVVFASTSSTLVANDRNRLGDLFGFQLEPWGDLDSDDDGIPDLWMLHHFGHVNGEAGDNSRPDDDADGDGSSNKDEFLAGTDPSVPESVLKADLVRTSNGLLVLLWDAVPGRNYRVVFNESLADGGWVEVAAAIRRSSNQASMEIEAAEGERYYRVQAW